MSLTGLPRSNGHGSGTATRDGVAAHGEPTRQRDIRTRTPGWPRLMPLSLAGEYLGVSEWTVREWVFAGDLPVVRVRRPRTASALKHKPVSEALRRVLVDRADLDALADSFTKERR